MVVEILTIKLPAVISLIIHIPIKYYVWTCHDQITLTAYLIS